MALPEKAQARFAAGHEVQQALMYAEMSDALLAISSNGNGFIFHYRSG